MVGNFPEGNLLSRYLTCFTLTPSVPIVILLVFPHLISCGCHLRYGFLYVVVAVGDCHVLHDVTLVQNM